jgi:hypothetical protein
MLGDAVNSAASIKDGAGIYQSYFSTWVGFG